MRLCLVRRRVGVRPAGRRRLRYNGSAHIWGFAIYLASRDGYQDSVLPSGSPLGTAEDALDCACGLYSPTPPPGYNPRRTNGEDPVAMLPGSTNSRRRLAGDAYDRGRGDWKGIIVGISGIISALIVGLIIGLLGRLVVPGRQKISIWLTMLIGVVAALIGTLLASLIGVSDTKGIDWIELLLQIVLAAAGVLLVTRAGISSIRGIGDRKAH
jgi:uncharacterized membrane protein YeaQ/YmgE (transglycosylase-associated protein family)